MMSEHLLSDSNFKQISNYGNVPGRIQTIDLDYARGEIATYSIEAPDIKLTIGYSLGGDLNFFHSKNNGKVHAVNLLKVLNVKYANKVLKIAPQHRDDILINEDGKSDAIISTWGAPVVLSPADCIGLCIVDPESGIFGIAHSGRAGIGLNISRKFIFKFHNEILKKGSKGSQIQIFIPPHIFGSEYPHNDNRFAFDENGNPNWWSKNSQSFAPEIGGKFYPDIGAAVAEQTRKAFTEICATVPKITATGLSTFQGYGHSYSKNQNDPVKKYYRNLIFVGMQS